MINAIYYINYNFSSFTYFLIFFNNYFLCIHILKLKYKSDFSFKYKTIDKYKNNITNIINICWN